MRKSTPTSTASKKPTKPPTSTAPKNRTPSSVKPQKQTPLGTVKKAPKAPPQTVVARKRRTQVLMNQYQREMLRNGTGPASNQFSGGTPITTAFAPYILS
jgi:hypothetical protein